MGEYFDQFMKRPNQKRQQEILQRISARGASMALQRGFGESMDAFFQRNPNLAAWDKERIEDRKKIERWKF
ncbi:MAG: hypothetical protein MUP03_09570 [Anaerolineales bacterium]|nr:hypothetical protein [Anaerolineales bacterium]